MLDHAPFETCSIGKVAQALQIGQRAAKEISARNGALLENGNVDAQKLFAALGFPKQIFNDFLLGKIILLTSSELAERSDRSARTIRNRAKAEANSDHPVRSFVLVGHKRLFLATDVLAREYEVPGQSVPETIPDHVPPAHQSGEEFPSEIFEKFDFMMNLDTLIPDPPRQKQARKK